MGVIVTEKELHLKSSMQMMGLKSSVFWITSVGTNMMYNIFSALVSHFSTIPPPFIPSIHSPWHGNGLGIGNQWFDIPNGFLPQERFWSLFCFILALL
jgi:hypothetical protein